MSRQFRSDDTSKWLDGFGNGSNSDLTISGSTTLGATHGAYWGTFSGSSGATSGTVPSGFSWTGPVILHQTIGTGAGAWELNYGVGGSGTTHNFKYPLQNNYTTGAQIITANQFNNLTINGGVTLSVPAWNGTNYGLGLFFVAGTLNIAGSFSASSAGYLGSSAGGVWNSNTTGGQGEGTAGARNTRSTAANGNGGGGGGGATLDGGPGAGGGGHANAGSNGNKTGSSNGTVGTGGSAAGNAGLTTAVFGGGGGGGASDNDASGVGGVGGNGGGGIMLIAKNITISGSIPTSGQNGSRGTQPWVGGGAGGAGGFVLLKCQTATLGTNLITAAAGSGEAGCRETFSSLQSYGGNGSVGRIHLDYKTSYTGSSTPTIDVTQDATLDWVPSGASFLFNFV